MTEKKCPSCEGINIAEIMYGYPSSEFLDELKKEENKGKYQLGGCCISNDDPAFSCNDCGFVFGNRKDQEYSTSGEGLVYFAYIPPQIQENLN